MGVAVRNKSGFTLIELMTVIAIVAIVLAFATPPFLQWLKNKALVEASDQVFSDLQNARLRAVKENANVLVAFDTANQSYRVFIDKNLNNQYDASTDTSLWTGNLPSGITFSSVSFGGAAWIGFTGMGTATSSGSLVLAGSNAKTQQITVDLPGTIQMGS